jgi:hypothetical protein
MNQSAAEWPRNESKVRVRRKAKTSRAVKPATFSTRNLRRSGLRGGESADFSGHHVSTR